MSDQKLRVLLLFGGRSVEHEISLLSAANIFKALDRTRFEITLVGIDKEGVWSLTDESVFERRDAGTKLPEVPSRSERRVGLIPTRDGAVLTGVMGYVMEPVKIDAVFPIIHGTLGEDGTLQGFLRLLSVPFVGPGVLGCALTMDKEAAKRLLRDAGVPVARSVALVAHEREHLNFQQASKELGLPLFVKPACLGSSVAVSKVKSAEEYTRALAEAFEVDAKVLVEEFVEGRELECAVLGNEQPLASRVGEVVPDKKHDFYSYDAKYLDPNGAAVVVPADLPIEVEERVRKLAVKAFEALYCEGLSRVDFFLRKDGQIFVNELNALPGFTSISMYPKLWALAGVTYTELISRLIDLALERFKKERALRVSYS